MAHFFGAWAGTRLEGMVGIEFFGTIALLRSLAVIESRRRCGLGATLLAQVEQYAAENRVRALYLLTTTAQPYLLVHGDAIGERLAKVAAERGILLMSSDKCCYEKQIDVILVQGATIGCLPNIYAALSGNMPDHIVRL